MVRSITVAVLLLAIAPGAWAWSLTEPALKELVADTVQTLNSPGLLPDGWSLDASKVKVKLVSNGEYRSIVSRRTAADIRLTAERAPGISGWLQRHVAAPLAGWGTRLLNAGSDTRGQYVSDGSDGEGTVYLVTDGSPTEAHVRERLAHELTHAAQDQNVPGLARRERGALADSMNKTLSPLQRAAARQRFLQYQLLAEGQAVQVQQQFGRRETQHPSGIRPNLLQRIANELSRRLSTSFRMTRNLLGTYAVGPSIPAELFGELWRDENAMQRTLGPTAEQMDAMTGQQVRRALGQQHNPWAAIAQDLVTTTGGAASTVMHPLASIADRLAQHKQRSPRVRLLAPARRMRGAERGSGHLRRGPVGEHRWVRGSALVTGVRPPSE